MKELSNHVKEELIGKKLMITEELYSILSEAKTEVDKWEDWQKSRDPEGEKNRV
jgi:hypothetical protein